MTGETIGADLPALARAAPSRTALVCDGDVLDRAALAACVGRLAREIAARTKPGDGIALAMGNSPLLVEMFLACAVSGRQALVYDTGWPAPYRQAIDDGLRPALTVTEDWPVGEAAPFPAPPSPDSAFYVGFTSGSTGLPKGYRRSHTSWINSFSASEVEFGLTSDDVVMAPGGLSASLHLYGVVHALHLGAQAVMMRQFHPRRALRLMAEHSVTTLYATPTQLQMLLEAGTEPLLSLRKLMISGAKWRPETRAATARLFPNGAIAEFYGASETSFISVAHSSENVPAGSVGRAVYGVKLRIRDRQGHDLPPGEIGTIWVGSTMLFQDYACGGGDEIRREGGFMTVGDHGRLDESGFLYLHGREKRMLVTSGLNVYPEEVEAVLASLQGIEEAAVFGLPDELRGVELVAVLRGAFEEAEFRASCRRRLPAAKIPRRLFTLDDWPRTASGKADLIALRAIVEQRLAR